MTKFIRFCGIIVVLFCWKNSDAQIYSQGKNLNNQNTFFLNVELKTKPLDASKFHALVNFYGKRKDVDYYLKEGVEHKSFADKDNLIAYMEDNGWYYLQTEKLKARSNDRIRTRYLFRKSMMRLSEEHEEITQNISSEDP